MLERVHGVGALSGRNAELHDDRLGCSSDSAACC